MIPRVAILSIITGSLLAASHSSAQGIYNSASLHIGTDVFVNGEIFNTGIIENDGALSLTSDWQNDGLYAGSGSLALVGSNSQRIKHQDQQAATLILNGSGPKYVKGSINVTGKFILINGIVHVSSADNFFLSDSATVIGGSRESFVNGAITTRGTGYKFFPVGKNGTYAPIELLDVKGKSCEFSIEVFENAPLITVDGAIVRRSLYWQRKDLAGVFSGSGVVVDFDRTLFKNPENLLLITGTRWHDPFAVVSVERSEETDKVISRSEIHTPLILLGETGHRWNGADFYLSTTLSPNASRIENRSIRIFGERLDAAEFHFQIFNRWGQQIFESTSLEGMSSNGWDGRAAGGSQSPAGTYPYRLTGREKTGERFEKTGTITLIY